MAAVGFTRLSEPLRGSWLVQGYPETVSLAGRVFKRARWAQRKRFVVAQYREDVPHDSMHLLVRSDGTWVIDHTDAANPDRGLVISHAFRDVLDTPGGALLLTLGAVLVSAGVSYALTRR